jgi:hypothetical protein
MQPNGTRGIAFTVLNNPAKDIFTFHRNILGGKIARSGIAQNKACPRAAHPPLDLDYQFRSGFDRKISVYSELTGVTIFNRAHQRRSSSMQNG